MRMRHIAISGSPRLENIFPQYLINSGIFHKSYWTQNACCYSVCNVRLKLFSFQKEMREIWSKTYIGLHVKYRLLLSDINETWIFSTDFRKKNSEISNFMKIRPVGA
jgi:hypothetical protein